MAKNDYISDNLITMRDRLRESTAALREAAEQKRSQPPAESSAPLPETAPVSAAPPEYVPESAADRRLADGLRARQDLFTRIARDAARIEKSLETLDARRNELRRAKDALDALNASLEALSPHDPAGRFAADTDRLRLEYFRLCGTLDALAPAADCETARDDKDGTPDDRLQKAAWIVGLAVLAAAGIIAGVIAAIFR